MAQRRAPDAQPRYQDLPPLTDGDYQRLKDSIEDHGLLEPVVVDEDGMTLDGHHRVRAWTELANDPLEIPTRVLAGLSEQEKRNYAFWVNAARRHMSVEQKTQVVRDWNDGARSAMSALIADPKLSDREIAKTLGLHHSTVAKYRGRLEDEAKNGGTAIPTLRRVGRGAPREITDEPSDPDTRTMANHMSMVRFDFTAYYQAPPSQERTRDGLPYPRESEPSVWTAEDVYITSPAPQSATELDAFVNDIAFRLKQEMLRNPLLTMLGSGAPPELTSVGATSAVYVG